MAVKLELVLYFWLMVVINLAGNWLHAEPDGRSKVSFY